MARKKKQTENGFEDLSSYSSMKEYKKHRGGRKRFTPRRLAAMAACLLLVVAGAGLMMLSAHLDGMTPAGLTRDKDRLGISESTLSVEGVTNVAVFGVDSRSGGFAGPSDLVMVLTADEPHGKVKVTSVLGGSQVLIQGRDQQGDEVDTAGPLRTAYELGGPELAIRTLNQNFGLDITDYVALNFNGMAAIVDALGGVEVRLTAEEVREINVNLQLLARDVEVLQGSGTAGDAVYPLIAPSDFIPDASGKINIASGNYVGGVFRLNGNQAVAYARIRSIDSDSVRADRQQVVLGKILRTLSSDRTRDLKTWARALLPHCVTSLDLDRAAVLGGILGQGATLETVIVPEEYYETDLREETAADGSTVLVYDLESAAKRIRAFVFEERAGSWSTYGDTGRQGERNSALD